MSNNNSKEHYKMYKDGKRWVFASISVMTVMLTGAFHADNVHADTTDDTNSEISNNNTTNYLSQSQVVLDNRPAAKGENLPASKDKQVTTPTDSEGDKNNIDILNNEVKTDEQIKDNSSNISSVSSNAEVTTVKAESSLNNADSHKSVATSDAMSVNSASVANSSEAIITSSATDANSAVTANSGETIITSSATGANSAVTTNSSAVSVNNEVTATSSVTSANSAVVANSSEASLNSEAVVNSNVANVDSEATTTNGVDISRNNVVLHSSSVTDNDIQKVNMVSRTEVTPQITSSIHVSNWDEFTNALTNKDINEIIVDNNITATNSNSQTIAVRDNNTLLIRSNDDGRYAIDFRSAYPKGQLNLTYENIDLYGMVYYGVINTNVGLSSAPSSITFRNTSYTGAQLVYAGDSTTIIFQGKNSIKTVDSYTSLVDGSMVSVGNSQQALEFTGKDDHIIFDENSIFEGSTFKDNVIRMTGNNSSITVKKGAVVTLTPHDNGTGLGGSAEWGSKANGIYMSGSGVLTVENGGTLNINAGENSSQGVAAISITDPNTTVHINEGGTININVTGNISSYSGSGQSANTAVYINGQLKTDYGASFNVNGYDMGTFSGTLVKISGNAKLLGSTFKISLDDATSGTGTIILLDAGGNVSIENPKDFLLHLGTNSQAQWIKNGSFSLSKARLKTNNTTTGPFKTISFTIRDGNILVTDADSKNIIGLTQADENSLISLLDQLGSDESIASLEFVQANDEVEIIDNNVTITKENGNYLEVSGYTDIPGAYIHATINGNEFAGQKLDSPYWRENGIDSTVVYAAQSSMVKDPNGKGYKFTFEIPNDIVNTLAPGAMIDLYATFNFVDSDIVSADLGILGVQQYKDNVNLAANDAISHINGLTNLTDQQKERLVSQVDTIVTNTSDKFIDDVSQNSTNTAIYNSFIDDLNTITGLADGQDNAMNLLQTAAENTINDIENIDGLTSTQISDYESQINNVRNDAILEIGQTLSPEDALTAEQNGEISFTNIKNAAKLQAAKNDGIAKLDEAKNTTIAQITESGLSADRQTALINAVNEAHDTAVDKVTADTTIAQVNQDTTDGVNAINSIAGTVTEESEALQAAQETAQNAINAAAEAAKNDINNNASLTADEKHDLVAAVDEAVNTAKNQIAQATSPDEATEATQTGEANIAVVSDAAKLQAAKNDALAAIDTAITNAIAAIENNTSLTAGQKDAYKEQITNTATDAKNDINQATNVADVTTAEDAGAANISAVSDAAKLQAAKNDAVSVIDTAATNAIAAIENNTSLTAGQKDAYKAQITNAATDAKNAINQATNAADVTTAEDAGAANISAVSDAAKLQAAKNDGIAKLDEAKDATITQIKQSGLSTDRQTALINAVNEAYDTAVDQVTAGTTIVQVNQDTMNGVNAISNIADTVTEESETLKAEQEAAKLQATKNKAIAKINDVKTSVINKIKDSVLNINKQSSLINIVNKIYNDVRNNINNGVTIEQVVKNMNDGINKIIAMLDLLNSEFSQVNDEQCVINYEDSTKNSNDMVNKLVLNNSAYNQINDGNSKDNKTLNLPNTNVYFNDKTNFNSLLEELLGLMVMLSLGGILRKDKNKSE
ncbi:DUF1542 domain-containing protein [Weissella hellenica]|nr:DUF1542 domain-containing protein [Weissella hellenica]